MDRNFLDTNITLSTTASLSARRAWIEIARPQKIGRLFVVALRKESVDRNDTVEIVIVKMYASLSARRAWIEICRKLFSTPTGQVALRKESVDRNFNAFGVRYRHIVALRKESVDRNGCGNILVMSENRRSPQGERG